jgi:hypothetical protein
MFDIVNEGPKGIGLIFGDQNSHLDIEIRTFTPGELTGLGIGLFAGFVLEFDPNEESRVRKLILMLPNNRLNRTVNKHPGATDLELAGAIAAASNYLTSSDPTNIAVLNEIQSPGQNNAKFRVDQLGEIITDNYDSIDAGEILDSSVFVFKNQ